MDSKQISILSSSIEFDCAREYTIDGKKMFKEMHETNETFY